MSIFSFQSREQSDSLESERLEPRSSSTEEPSAAQEKPIIAILDPVELDEKLTEIIEAGSAFDSTGDDLDLEIQGIALWFRGRFLDFKERAAKFAGDTLTAHVEARKALEQALQEARQELSQVTTSLRQDIKGVLKEARLVRRRGNAKVDELKGKVRDLVISITGNPDLKPQIPGLLRVYLPLMAAIVLTGVLDVLLNFDIFLAATNQNASVTLSIVFSLALGISAFLAGYQVRANGAYKDACVEFRKYFKLKPDTFETTDPETENRVMVQPRPAISRLLWWLGHAGFLGLSASLLIFRTLILINNPEVGGESGVMGGILLTIGVIAINFVLYLYEVALGVTKHPLLGDYLEQSSLLEELERALKSNSAKGEVEKLYADYLGTARLWEETLKGTYGSRITGLIQALSQLLEVCRSGHQTVRETYRKMVGAYMTAIIASNPGLEKDPRFAMEDGALEEIDTRLLTADIQVLDSDIKTAIESALAVGNPDTRVPTDFDLPAAIKELEAEVEAELPDPIKPKKRKIADPEIIERIRKKFAEMKG
jgi:uncharacterized membrane protein